MSINMLICCILFHFYIKPQLNYGIFIFFTVVSYSISTSNHNLWAMYKTIIKLYLIPFLHQTTTSFHVIKTSVSCILFHFYIKPQLDGQHLVNVHSCILFHFYIKPQPLFSSIRIGIGCILFHFYIKPQHKGQSMLFH